MEIDYSKIQRKIRKGVNKEICCSKLGSSILLEGEVESWNEVIQAGKIAAKKGYKGVVNRITVKGLDIPKIKRSSINDKVLEMKKVDVLIIGGGVIGSAIARELSKWQIDILLVEKEEDLAMHTSSRNDGMIHPGIEAPIGSKKSIFNIRGNELYTRISKELGIDLNRCGSTVLFEKSIINIAKPFIMSRAKKVGVKDVTFLSKNEVKQLEPNVLDDIVGAVHFGTTGIISPYKTTYAYAENAAMNGVEFSFNTVVSAINRVGNEILSVETNRGTIYPKIVINAAGVYADKIADMAKDQFFTIHPRKGESLILDKKKGNLINGVVAMPSLSLSKGNTKGGGVVKTIEGNILVGPDAYEQPYREDYSTNKLNIDAIINKQLKIVPKLSKFDVITYYAGIRASTYEEDFIIEASENVNNLIYAAGIQSPGLASAPAIAEEIEKITCNLLKNKMAVKPNINWNPIRLEIPVIRNLSFEERAKIIKERPAYGEIICRCEEISRGEIEDAINSPIPVTTLDGVKKRVRPGAGRCQGGFCTPHVLEIIKNNTGKDYMEITKKGEGSSILIDVVQQVYKVESENNREVIVNEEK